MPEYLSIKQARQASGLRLVLTAMPGPPWTEAAKAIFQAKRIEYTPVAQIPLQTNNELLDWTGFENAPIAIYNDEKPRAGWADILFLAERLAPEPSLIPDDPAQRAHMFGLAHELCGEDGLTWNRRYLMIWDALDPAGRGGITPELAEYLAVRYSYTPALARRAPARIKAVLQLFSQQLQEQKARGSNFLIGDQLSALDLYWSTHMALIRPLDNANCAMPDFLRKSYTVEDENLLAAIDPGLWALRERVYRDYLVLPIDA